MLKSKFQEEGMETALILGMISTKLYNFFIKWFTLCI